MSSLKKLFQDHQERALLFERKFIYRPRNDFIEIDIWTEMRGDGFKHLSALQIKLHLNRTL